jgi:nucleobase transporter 1/2
MRSLQGALIIAGVFQAVVGFFGIWRVFIRLVFYSFCTDAVSQTCSCSCTDAVAVPWPVHLRFLSPLAAVPFVTLSGLGLFYFAFPGVSSRAARPSSLVVFFGHLSLLAC